MSDKNIHQKINISLPASDDKTKDYSDRNTGGQVNPLHVVTQRGLFRVKICIFDFVLLLAVEGNCLPVLRVVLRTLDEWKCFRCLEEVILWSRLCLAMDQFRFHR